MSGIAPEPAPVSGEVDALVTDNGMLLRSLTDANNALVEAEAALERMRAALAFYGDVHKYPSPLTGGMGALWSDCGAVARAALASCAAPGGGVGHASPVPVAKDAALALIAALKRVEPAYDAANDLGRELQGDFAGHRRPIDDCVFQPVIDLLDAALGDDAIASYFLFECQRRPGSVTEADGRVWPLATVEDLRAYVYREQPAS